MKKNKYLDYLNNLNRNRKIILDSNLNSKIKICYRINEDELLINKDNLTKINRVYLKRLGTIKGIVLDCELINFWNTTLIKEISKDLKNDKIIALDKVHFKNIYLIEGNKLTQKVFNKIKLILKYNNLDMNKTIFKIKNYNSNLNYFLNELADLITAYQIKDKKQKFTFIYEQVSKELDKRFRDHNVCGFKDNLCSTKVCLQHKYDLKRLKTGCCFTKGRVCPNLDKDHCKINCLGCKFFTCYPLRFKGIYYHPKDFLLIKNFFNDYQIYLIKFTLFTDKDDMVDILLRKKKVPKTPFEY